MSRPRYLIFEAMKDRLVALDPAVTRGDILAAIQADPALRAEWARDGATRRTQEFIDGLRDPWGRD